SPLHGSPTPPPPAAVAVLGAVEVAATGRPRSFSFTHTPSRATPTHARACRPSCWCPGLMRGRAEPRCGRAEPRRGRVEPRRGRAEPRRGRPDSGVSVPIGVGQPDGEHGALESVALLTAALHVHGSPEPPDRLDDQRQPDPARARLLMALPLVGLDPVVLRRPAPLEDRVDVLLVDAGPVIADLDRESP